MQKETKKEHFQFYNSLTGLIKGLENEYTIIDLQNEECVSGKIKYVDGYMNIDLEDVIFYNSRGVGHKFEQFFVRGRLIRYVHIPKHLVAVDVFKKYVGSLKRIKPRKPVHTFKRSRAMKYHKDTIADAYAKT
ncbi:hypothetical protein PPYR_01965 [Photinus pyralis]|uniref:Sm domain-containing protein n=1 Tax=Photinus pyralis TaxID=7054 RepID=A0A1Y1KY33_PHOPY|nr:hypothetical protein PPYR_01965 [Photinus pyralis]